MVSVDIKHFETPDLADYLCADAIGQELTGITSAAEATLGCNRWLAETPAKRMIYQRIYGDLLRAPRRLRVLDVGGGVTAFTKILGKSVEYGLVDILAHDDEGVANDIVAASGIALIKADWYQSAIKGPYDIIISNDLLPNVDQRLKLFLDKFMPMGKQLRVLLTYYNNDRYYEVKRVNADEVMYLQAWSGGQLAQLLQQYFPHLPGESLEGFSRPRESLYPNGRMVSLLTITQG